MKARLLLAILLIFGSDVFASAEFRSYLPGQFEIIVKPNIGQVTIALPLSVLNASILKGIDDAGRNSSLRFHVVEGGLEYGPDGSRTLRFTMKIDGDSVGFQCRNYVEFAIPLSDGLKIDSQVLVHRPNCTVSNDILTFMGVGFLMTDVVALGFNTALNRHLVDPKDERQGSIAEGMKNDPDVKKLLDNAKFQAKYCSTGHWQQALCVSIFWEGGLFPYLQNVLDHAPQPKGSLPNDNFMAIAQAFESVAPRKPLGAYRFPSKLHGNDATLLDEYDDNDMALFGGLICFFGNVEGCNLVAKSQDDAGRFWRSPAKVGSPDVNPFSPDQLEGVIAYLIATSDAAALHKFLGYIKQNKVPVPSSSPVDMGYKSCTNDVNDTCLISPSSWNFLNALASRMGLGAEVPPDVQNVEQAFFYTDEGLPYQALFNPRGFRMHLVALEIAFARALGTANQYHAMAAAVLASREPNNPFFLFLHLGPDLAVLDQLKQKCVLNASQPGHDEWFLERTETDAAWKSSMQWDCAAMYRMLAKPPWTQGPTGSSHDRGIARSISSRR